MSWTKYSTDPAENAAPPPDGAPEGMAPSAVNDVMRDMMAEIRMLGESIANGSLPGSTAPLPVASGGTGAVTAAAARIGLGLGTAATRNTGTSGANVPLLDGNNSWSGNATFTGQLTYQLTDNGAGSGPDFHLLRESASPAASDLLGRIHLQGRDSNGTVVSYVRIGGEIISSTGGSASGRLNLFTRTSDSITTAAWLAQGLVVGSPTGGDKGAGTVNATDFYRNGTLIELTRSFESQEQSVSQNGSGSVSHGLGGRPRLAIGWLRCVSADQGFAVNDEIPLLFAETQGTNKNFILICTGSTIEWRFANSAAPIAAFHKTSGGGVDLDASKWRLVIRAYR